MAIVYEYKHPNGCTVAVHDDYLDPDQQKAWKEAYEVAARIHWQHVMAGLASSEAAAAEH